MPGSSRWIVSLEPDTMIETPRRARIPVVPIFPSNEVHHGSPDCLRDAVSVCFNRARRTCQDQPGRRRAGGPEYGLRRSGRTPASGKNPRPVLAKRPRLARRSRCSGSIPTRIPTRPLENVVVHFFIARKKKKPVEASYHGPEWRGGGGSGLREWISSQAPKAGQKQNPSDRPAGRLI